MSQLGMQAISNPSEMFISEQYSDSEVLAGLAVAVIMDGTRAFLIEIQVGFHCFQSPNFPFYHFFSYISSTAIFNLYCSLCFILLIKKWTFLVQCQSTLH